MHRGMCMSFSFLKSNPCTSVIKIRAKTRSRPLRYRYQWNSSMRSLHMDTIRMMSEQSRMPHVLPQDATRFATIRRCHTFSISISTEQQYAHVLSNRATLTRWMSKAGCHTIGHRVPHVLPQYATRFAAGCDTFCHTLQNSNEVSKQSKNTKHRQKKDDFEPSRHRWNKCWGEKHITTCSFHAALTPFRCWVIASKASPNVLFTEHSPNWEATSWASEPTHSSSASASFSIRGIHTGCNF